MSEYISLQNSVFVSQQQLMHPFPFTERVLVPQHKSINSLARSIHHLNPNSTLHWLKRMSNYICMTIAHEVCTCKNMYWHWFACGSEHIQVYICGFPCQRWHRLINRPLDVCEAYLWQWGILALPATLSWKGSSDRNPDTETSPGREVGTAWA